MITCKFRSVLRYLSVLAVLAATPKTVDADWYLDSEFDPDSNLAIYEGAGSGFVNYLAVQEGVRADFGFGGIPVSYNFQAWDGTEWPNELFSDFVDSPDSLAGAQADVEQFSTTDQLPYYMSASIGGTFAGGLDMAAGAALDVTLELDANTLAVFEIFDAFVDIDGVTGASGIGFAGIRLYDPTVGLNDPGGINNPFAHQFISQSEGGASGQDLSFLVEFDNLSGTSTMFQELRLETYAVVFTNAVPEPGSFALLAVLGCFVATRRRRLA